MKFKLSLLGFVLLLAACSTTKTGPVGAVERYYEALVKQDQSQIATIVCVDFEESARTEIESFKGVKSELVDVACTQSQSGESEAVVTCSGKIQASYGNEVLDFPLSDREHKVVKQSGEWLVCGY